MHGKHQASYAPSVCGHSPECHFLQLTGGFHRACKRRGREKASFLLLLLLADVQDHFGNKQAWSASIFMHSLGLVHRPLVRPALASAINIAVQVGARSN